MPAQVKVDGEMVLSGPMGQIIEDEAAIPSEAGPLTPSFYAGSSNFIPCFDPLIDTWER